MGTHSTVWSFSFGQSIIMATPQRESPLSVPLHQQMCDFRRCGTTTNNHGRSDSFDENHEQTILEREMEKLSIHEKTKLHRGIMGDSVTATTILQRWSGEGLAEGPVFLKLKLAELDHYIQTRISSQQGGRSYEAYQMAVAQNEHYVNRPEFKITFLRATRYDTKKATTKILWYFDLKLELFGPSVVGRDICWDDLSPEAKVYMNRGDLQLLPKRDKFGRKIIFWSDSFGPKVLTPGEVLGMRQAWLYFLSCLGDHDDEPGRTRGYVYLRWAVHLKDLPHWCTTPAVKTIQTLHGWIPVKIAVVHHCYPPLLECIHWVQKTDVLHQFNSYVARFKRFIVHYGTELECKDRMMKGYGFPVDALPLAYDIPNHNNYLQPNHTIFVDKWIATQHHIEQSKKNDIVTSSSTVESLAALQRMLLTPDIEADYRDEENRVGANLANDSFGTTFTNSEGAIAAILSDEQYETKREGGKPAKTATKIDHYGIQKTDVLMVQGMNAALRIHPGNIRFRTLVEDHYPAYSTCAKKSQKTKLSESIVRKVASWGGRFMKWVPERDVWIEVDFLQARTKVALTFRDITKSIKRKTKS